MKCVATIVSYGSTNLLRAHCPACKDKAYIIENKFDCCGNEFKKTPGDWFSARREIECLYRRKKPSTKEIAEIRNTQDGRCFYCNVKFGEPFLHPRLQKIRFTKMVFDHFIPFSFSQNNHGCNFVIACQICNGIKSSKIFPTEEDAKEYVKYHREKKGYKNAFCD